MSAGSDLGPWARFAGLAPRLASDLLPLEPEATGVCAAELCRVHGYCHACGVPYSGFAHTDTVVIRVDRLRWRIACPKALLIDDPGVCRALQATCRPDTHRHRAARSQSVRS